MIYVLRLLLLTSFVSPSLYAQEELISCEKAEVSFYGKLERTELEKDKVVLHSELERLPEKWTKKSGDFKNVYIEVKEEPVLAHDKIRVRYSLNEGRKETFSKIVSAIEPDEDNTNTYELDGLDFDSDLIQKHKYSPAYIKFIFVRDGKDICQIKVSITTTD